MKSSSGSTTKQKFLSKRWLTTEKSRTEIKYVTQKFPLGPYFLSTHQIPQPTHYPRNGISVCKLVYSCCISSIVRGIL